MLALLNLKRRLHARPLGLARNIVQRYALETCSEQGFGIDEKIAHHCVDRQLSCHVGHGHGPSSPEDQRREN
jgi:hypothetical protein